MGEVREDGKISPEKSKSKIRSGKKMTRPDGHSTSFSKLIAPVPPPKMHAAVLAPLKPAPARATRRPPRPAGPVAQIVWTLRACRGDPKHTAPGKSDVVLDLSGEKKEGRKSGGKNTQADAGGPVLQLLGLCGVAEAGFVGAGRGPGKERGHARACTCTEHLAC